MIGVEVPMNWWSGKLKGVLPGDFRSYNNPKLKESEHVDESLSKDSRFHVKFQGFSQVSFLVGFCVFETSKTIYEPPCCLCPHSSDPTLRMAPRPPTQQWQIWKSGRIS